MKRILTERFMVKTRHEDTSTDFQPTRAPNSTYVLRYAVRRYTGPKLILESWPETDRTTVRQGWKNINLPYLLLRLPLQPSPAPALWPESMLLQTQRVIYIFFRFAFS